MSNFSFPIFHFLSFQMILVTSSPHSMNQLAMLLTSPYLGLDFYSQPSEKGLESHNLGGCGGRPASFFRFRRIHPAFPPRRMVAPTYPASNSTPCSKCWRFGHSAPWCKQEALACPFCTLPHNRSAQRCANQSCPKGGFEKSVVGCCNASPPLCVTCGGQNASFDATCPVRREFLSSLRPPRDQEIPDAPDAGLPQTTPQGPTAPPIVPATPARHGPRFPASSQSTHPVTVRLLRSASAQPYLATPLPGRNCFGAGSTRFQASSGLTGASPPRATSSWIFRCHQTHP